MVGPIVPHVHSRFSGSLVCFDSSWTKLPPQGIRHMYSELVGWVLVEKKSPILDNFALGKPDPRKFCKIRGSIGSCVVKRNHSRHFLLIFFMKQTSWFFEKVGSLFEKIQAASLERNQPLRHKPPQKETPRNRLKWLRWENHPNLTFEKGHCPFAHIRFQI